MFTDYCWQVLDLMQEVAEGGSGPSSSLNCDPWTRVEGRVPLHGKGPHSAGAVRGGGDTNESGDWASSSRDATSCQDDETGDTSDSDSAVMMSGNSPYISKTARCNFLFRRSGDCPQLLFSVIIKWHFLLIFMNLMAKCRQAGKKSWTGIFLCARGFFPY